MTTAIRFRSRGFVACAATALLVAFGAASAFATATITIVNNNAAGVGFNDPTPRAPVGGNPGMTLGDQRLFIFTTAANIWGNVLTSPVPILVRAQFANQTCNATGATLGSTGVLSSHRDFAGAPFAGTWYPQSLANRLFGSDLNAASPDMNTTFNMAIDTGCFGPGLVWYYGIDGLEGVNIEMLPVALHEIGHGLGCTTTTSGTSGNWSSGFPHVYDHFLMDNTNGLHWSDPLMTPAQRAASAISVNHLVWDGPRGIAEAAGYLGPRPQLQVNVPALANMEVQTASFGPAITLAGFTGDVVLAEDGTDPITDICEPVTNGGAITGKIALVDRGTCTFVSKALAVQAAGAVGMIVANNVAAGLPGMGGTDPTITIPCIGISQADGNTLKANLGMGVNVTMLLNPALMAGADPNGKPLMYAPNPFAGGSSVAHWDISMSPNALMEPSISPSLHDAVDISHGMFVDIGWFPESVPVELDQFTAEGSVDGITVRWHFTDLSDVASITLERALDAAGPWAPIETELDREGEVMVAFDRNVEIGPTYYYHLRTTDRSGQVHIVGLASGQRLSESFRLTLGSPSPNPAVNGTSVNFQIGKAQRVNLTITDVSGRTVRTLRDGAMLAGSHVERWDGKNDQGTMVSAGVYFLRLHTDSGEKTQRVTIVR